MTQARRGPAVLYVTPPPVLSRYAWPTVGLPAPRSPRRPPRAREEIMPHHLSPRLRSPFGSHGHRKLLHVSKLLEYCCWVPAKMMRRLVLCPHSPRSVVRRCPSYGTAAGYIQRGTWRGCASHQCTSWVRQRARKGERARPRATSWRGVQLRVGRGRCVVEHR
eukprot:scaffold323_cov414-Prasinococcus_capsulatus_cf.AAC.58